MYKCSSFELVMTVSKRNINKYLLNTHCLWYGFSSRLFFFSISDLFLLKKIIKVANRLVLFTSIC